MPRRYSRSERADGPIPRERVVVRNEKILITGPAGQIAFPLAQALAEHNDVWGIARFTDPAGRERVERAGVTTRVVDLAAGEFGDLPDDFTYVLHLASFLGGGTDYDVALRTNAEGTGLLLRHCRRAKAAMVMTTGSVYRPHDDPWHAYTETDPLGDSRLPMVPTYSMSKIGEEAVARTCARLFDLPVVIARMNAAYGHNGGMVVHYMDAVVERRAITLRWDPNPYSPIFESDLIAQTAGILSAASVPATIVNWGSDEPLSMQDACRFMGELAGREPDLRVTEVPGAHRGVVIDPTKRLRYTDPCAVSWQDGLRAVFEARYPDGPDGPRRAGGAAAHAMDPGA
jgi:nucleoside-diphosphate-sugar epimerase